MAAKASPSLPAQLCHSSIVPTKAGEVGWGSTGESTSDTAVGAVVGTNSTNGSRSVRTDEERSAVVEPGRPEAMTRTAVRINTDRVVSVQKRRQRNWDMCDESERLRELRGKRVRPVPGLAGTAPVPHR